MYRVLNKLSTFQSLKRKNAMKFKKINALTYRKPFFYF